MRILHTADWHLGRLFHQASLIEDQRVVLWQIADYVHSHDVDVLLISGDIYDRAIPPVAAVNLLSDFLDYLQSVRSVVVIVISGNHDSADRLSFGAAQLESAGVHIISSLSQVTRPVVVSANSVECSFFGIPYCDPAEVSAVSSQKIKNHDQAQRWLTDQIRQHSVSGQHTVVLAHCLVVGSEESDSERPINIGGADNVSATVFQDFTYTALGHLHSPQRCSHDHVRYSGSPLKYSFSEHEHSKSVELIELDSSGLSSVDTLPLTPRRDVRVISGLFDDIMNAGLSDDAREDYVLVRLQDSRAILDAMMQLREVYPNVLHLEKPGIASSGDFNKPARNALKRGEFHMFRDFFFQMTDQELSEVEEKVVRDVIDSVVTPGDSSNLFDKNLNEIVETGSGVLSE